MEMGARIRHARLDAGLTQTALADLVGATRQTVGLIETGDYNPSLKLCIALARALKCTLNDLFWEDDHADG